MRRSRRSRRAVSLLAIAGLVLGTATVVSAPASVAAPPPGLDQDVSDIWSGLESLQSFSQGLATDGALGTALTDVALIPGGSDGIGFVDLLQKTLTDRLDATDTTFAKLAAALNGNSVNLGSGRTAKVQVVPGSATGRESLAVTLDVTKRVSAAPLTIGTTSPKFDFAAPVQVDLALHGTFTVVYDTAARAVYLDTTSTAVPTFTLAADAHFPCSPASSTPPCTQDTSGVHAGIGILGVSLNSGSSLDLTTSLTATLRDPNADGKVYLGTISGSSFQPFAEPLNGGTTPGELNGGAAAVPGLVTLTGPTGALHATLNLAASTDSSITLPGVSATVQVDWNDVTSGSPTVNVTSGALSAIQSFENLTPGDLAQGLAGLATALEAVQMSRTYKPTSGGRAGTTAAIAAGALTATYTATSGGKPQVNDLFQVGGSGGPVREVSAVDGAGPYTVTFGSPLNTAVADGTTLTQVDAKGDIDLPFMKGTLADVFQANEAITGFLNKHVKQTYNAQPNANTGTVSGASGTSATYTVVDGGAPAAGEYYTIGDETLKVGSVSGTGPYNLSFTTPFAGAHADGSAATQVALGALVPDFSSLQSMLASLQTTQDLPGGSQFTVGDVGYDDTTHKLAIGLSISRAAGSAQDLDAFTPVDSGTISSVGTDAGSGAPTLKDTGKSWQTNAYAGHRVRSGSATNVVKSNDGSTLVLSGAWVGGTPGAGDAYDIGGQDAGTGAISFANKLDSLGGGSGILNANASVPLATVTPSYSVNLTVVLDLEAPQTGDGCKNKLFNGVVNTQACPFTSNNTDGTSTVVTTLPTPADRIMIRTVDGSNNPLHLLTADAPIASKVVVNASVGFLGLGLTGDLHECAAFTSGTTDCDSSQHLLSVDFQPGLGDAQHDISLAELFAKLASGPASLIKVTVTGAAKATITPKITGIPGLSDTDFFGAGGAPTLTLSMTDITDPSTIHLDANGGSVADALGKIKAFNFDTSNPKALFGEILQTLKTLSKLLKNVSSSGSPTIQAALDTKIPVVGLTLGDIFRSSEQGQGDHVKYTSTQVQDSDGHFTDELLLRTVVAGTSTGVITATTPTTLTIKQWQGGTPADGSQYQVENALDSAIDLLTANPADSLQSLISLVNERLGAASIPISISVDLSHGTPTLGLQLDWKRDFHFTTPVSFDFNVGGNDSSIVGTQASGLVQLHANAEAKVKLLLPLSADPTDESGAATPAGLLVDPTQTSLSAGVDAGVGGFVKANFGPLSLSLGDPTQPDGGSHPAEAHAAFGASFNSPDTAPESISTFLGNVGSNSVHLNGGVTGVSCANDTPPTTLGLCAALPVYLSTDGGQHYNPVNATNDPTKDPDTLRLRLPLVTATPSNIGDLADQFKLTDSSGNALPLSASDSTKRFELPPSLASDLAHAVLDFSQLGGGLDGYFKFAEQALNLASFGGKVPLIGKDLQQGAQFLEHVQGEVDGVLGDLASVGNEAQLRDWVDNKLNDALKDVLPAGGKITADFVCSAQLATPTNVAGTAAKTDTPTTGYQYRVAASDPKGDTAASAAITVTSSALSATNTITVTWTKVDGASGYRLYRSSDGGTTWKEFDVATSDTPSFTDTGAAGTDGTPPTGPNPDLSPCPISKTTGVTLTGDIGQGKISADKGCEDDGANLCIGSGNPGLHTPLNIGIPGLSLAAATNDDGTPDPTQELAVRVGWHIHLKIGLDLHRGFFVETQDQKNPEIQVGLAVQLPKSIQAQISFLKVNLCDFATGQSYPPTASPSCPFKPLVPNGVTRTAGSPTPLFAGAFGIDLHTPTASVTAFDDPGFTANDDAANDITLKDLTNLASLKKLVTVGISAKVHIDWDFQAVLDSSLPGVGGEFKLDWQWGTSLNKPAVATDSGNDATPPADGVAKPDIEFDNVYISAGGFLSGVLKPIIKEVQQFTSPLKPVIDTLYAPIPVLSDLSHLAGGGDVTLISIAEAFSTLAGGPDLTMVDRILQVIKLVNAIPTGDDGLGIFIGSFKVSSSKAVGTAATPDNTDSLIDTKTPAPASQNGNKSAADAMDGASNGSIGTAKSKAGFSFPILDNPSSVFNLLMGGDVDLIRFDSGNLSLGFSYSQQFGPVYAPPPVVITISGSASVSARIIAGFDTYGLRKAYEAIKSGQGAGSVIGSILDSLFLYTVDPTKDDGKPVPVLTLTGELAAGASVTVLIVSVGIEGGIKLTINFYWNDPDNDGKFRASEFAKTAINNPLCLFNVDGKLSVFLRLGVTIGFGPFSTTFHITLVDITLLDFSVHPDCTPPPPELGEVQGTTLYLFFGHLGGSGQRGEPWGNSGEDETVKVHELHDFTDPQHPTFAGFSVDGLGRHEEFRDSGLQTVVLDAGGYSGKETVIIGGDSNQSQPAADGPPTPLPFDRTAVVVGGDAADNIKIDGGTVFVDGKGGDDTVNLTGNGVAKVAGGAGNDTLTVGNGDDVVAGDSALDTSRPVTLTDHRQSEPKGAFQNISTVADSLGAPGAGESSSDGNDSIFAGYGANTLLGNGGNDQLSVATDKVLTGNETRQPGTNASKGDTIVGGTGDNNIHGGAGDDTIYAGQRWTSLSDKPNYAGESGDGNNQVDTGAGSDTVYGGSGADFVIGHSVSGGHDTVYGGGGSDVIAGGDGSDHLYGGPGPDYLSGGPAKIDTIDPADPTLGAWRITPTPDGKPVDHKLLVGGDGADHIVAGNGGDTIYGDREENQCVTPPAVQPRWTPPGETSTGTPGNDWVQGGAGDDNIAGGAGADILTAGTGTDVLCGEAGADKVYGGPGTDTLFGGSGDDLLVAGTGNSGLYGNDGADTVLAGSGNDWLEGNGGADKLDGGTGQSVLIGGSSTAAQADTGDTIFGGSGDNVLIGDNGTVDANSAWPGSGKPFAEPVVVHSYDLDSETPASFGGNDVITGGSGDVQVYAGVGDDYVVGGTGTDHLEGGPGSDTMYTGPAGDDVLGGTSPQAVAGGSVDGIPDGSANGTDIVPSTLTTLPITGNTISGFLPTGTTLPHADVIVGGNGSITRTGVTDPNTGGAVRAVQQLALLTVGGDDTITGGDGADQIFGGKGDDTIRTGDGENYVEGNQGTDTIFGGPGGNDIVGGTSPLTLPTSGADALTVAQVPDAGDTIYADGRTGGLPATPDTGDVVLGDNGCISRGTGGAPTLANGCPTGPSSAPTAWQFSAADLGSVDAGHPNGNLVRPVVRQLDVTDCPGGGSCTVDSRGGSDTIYGGSGDDVLLGETGNDRIFGGPDGTNGVDDTTGVFVGNDDVEGGAGSDTIAGGAGDDDLIGGTAPTYLPTGVTTSLVSDGTAGGAPLTVPGNPLLTIPGTGTLGNTIDGGGGADVILGGNGVITRTVSNGVWAVNGNDHAFIRTQADLDLLTIGGDDTLRGNLGDDKIFGALGNDTISGGFDDDYLEGGPGRNLVQGGQGADDIVGGTSPIALPSPPSGKTNDDVAAATPSGTDAGGGQRDGNVLCGFVCGGSTAAGDDDVIAANNARIDRCPATVSGGKGTPAGSDACTWGTTDYGNEKVGSAPGVAQSGAISTTGLGVARTRYVTLLGQSPTNTTSDGNDYVEGDSGNDVLYGEDGSDAVHGDTPLAGSPRVDECLATGPDANAGQDVIVGGYGSDTLCGDGGDDGIVGTRGLVTIVPFAKGSGPTTIGTTGGPPYGTFTYPSSGDTIDRVDLSKEYVNGVLTAVPNWNVATAAGQNSQHDVEFGGQGNDALHGSPGDDFLEGDDGPHVAGAPASTGGDDVLFGGDGNDSLQGGPGNDHAWGGTGNDDLDLRRSDSGIALKVNESRACQAMLFPTLTVAPAALLAAEGCSSTGYGMQSYASRFPLVSGSYDTDPGGDDNGGTGKNTSLFGDIMYGGFNRDVMQSQPTGLGDRMIDDNGAYNLEYVCTAPYGGWQINRALSPGLRSFVQQLAQADGAVDPATVTSSGGYEASIIYPGDAKGNAGQDYPGTPGHFTC